MQYNVSIPSYSLSYACIQTPDLKVMAVIIEFALSCWEESWPLSACSMAEYESKMEIRRLGFKKFS